MPSFAQNIPTITAKWRVIMEDTTLKKTKKKGVGPVQYKQDKEGNLYVNQQTNIGFQLSKIDAKTGKIIWSNGRNQDYGTTENRMYFPKDFFFRADGNIEIMAARGVKFPVATNFSTAEKLVYDGKTGKELFSYLLTKKGGSAVLLNNGALVDQVVRNENPTSYYLADGYGREPTVWIRALDTNFVARDTIELQRLPEDTLKDLLSIYGSSPLQKINGKLYCMISLFGGLDTANLKFYLYKVEPKTKKVITIDMSKKLFNSFDYANFENSKDGFLFCSYSDSLFSYTGNDSQTRRTMLAKIDTAGKVVWRTYFDTANNLKLPIVSSVDDNKTNGFWAVTSRNTGKKAPNYLYYLDAKGKAKLIGDIALPNEPFNYFTFSLRILNNGDLLVSYNYIDDLALPDSIEYSGTLCIDRAQIDKLLLSEKEPLLSKIELTCYPNPASNYINIQSAEAIINRISCIDTNGSVVSSLNCSSNQVSFPTYYLPNGTYFLQIESDKGYANKKVVILHE